MSDEIQKSNDEHAERDGLELLPVDLAAPELLARARKVAIGNVATFGAAFATMPEAMRQVTVNTKGLYRVVPQEGAVGLKSAKKGTDFVSGAWKMKDGKSKFAKFKPVGEVSGSVPYDPTTFAMAVALAEVNAKLDAIKEVQEDMFEYMRQKDAGERRGNLEYLVETLENFRANWINSASRGIRSQKVQDIRQALMQDMNSLKSQIESKLNKSKGLFKMNKDAEEKTSDVLNMLKEYQLDVYLFSFSSLLEALLDEDHDEGLLESLASRIETRSLEYREMYTRAYNMLELEGQSTVEQFLLGGISAAGKVVGKAIEKTPVGDKTRIDETLIGAGDKVGEFKDKQISSLMEEMPDAKMVDVRPFTESIRNLSEFCNKPTEMLTDGENIYLLPEDTE